MNSVPNPSAITAKLATMSNQQLAQFAQMHKNDPYMLPLASAEDARRRAIRQGAMAGKAGQQPTVADQAVDAIAQDANPQAAPQQQLPEQTGIAPLNAPNIQGMADGGIAGYAAGPDESRGVVDTAKYREYAIKKAQALGLNPRFVDSLFRVESTTKKHPEGYDPSAKSKTGPVGIGQLTKATAQAYGLKPSERYDPYKNMDASLAHISDLYKKYQGDERKVAVAYNQGETYLNNHLRQNKGKLVPEALDKAEPKKYIERIEAMSKGKEPSLARKAIEAVIPSAQAEENMSRIPPANMSVAPTRVSQLPPLPTAPVAAAPRPQAAPVEDYVDPMGGIASISQSASQAQSGTKSPVASTLASLVDTPLNAFTGTAGEITRALSRPFLSSEEADKKVREEGAGFFANPVARHVLGVENDPAYRQGPVNAALGKVAEGVDVVGGGIADVTGANKSDVTNAINLLPLAVAKGRNVIKKGGVEYNLPQKAKPGDAGLAALSERARLASEEAAAARAKTAPRADTQQIPLAAEPVQGELFPRERTPVQGELFPETVPQPKAPKAGEFAIAPETIAMQERAAQVRGEQSKVAAGLAERRAKDAAAAEAKYRAELEAPKPKSVLDKVAGAAEKTIVPTQGVLGAAQQTKVPPPPEKRPYEAFEENFRGTDAQLLPPPADLTKKEKKEVIADTKASPEGKEIKKSGMEFSDKDWLNMGLNLLAAKSEGQQGIQGFLGNVGTAGKATLEQKQEREKAEAAKAFQEIQGRYYSNIAENIGKPQGEERMIERIAKDQGISFADAADQFYTMKQPDRTNLAGIVASYQKAMELVPLDQRPTFEQWVQTNKIPLGAAQQQALNPEAMAIYNRVMNTKIGG